VQIITTPVGDARVDVRAADGGSRLTLVLGHGAGGGIETPDLVALARALPARGITVVRVEQPWRVAGRKVAAPPPTLDRAWIAVLHQLGVDGPVAVGGRSAGARVACRTALQVGAIGVVALAFPLHPPGRPEKSRLDELRNAGVPALVVQGDRDPFGGPAQFAELSTDTFPRKRAGATSPPAVPRAFPPYTIYLVPGADHSFRVPKGRSGRAALAEVTAAVADWLLGDRSG
jgi:uncharacterized protein